MRETAVQLSSSQLSPLLQAPGLSPLPSVSGYRRARYTNFPHVSRCLATLLSHLAITGLPCCSRSLASAITAFHSASSGVIS